MRVLDLFAGLGGWSAPFAACGHDVTTVDIEPAFGATITADVLTLGPHLGEFDVGTVSLGLLGTHERDRHGVDGASTGMGGVVLW